MKRDRITRRGWAWTAYRKRRIARDGGVGRIRCHLCGTTPLTSRELHLDHLIPAKHLELMFGTSDLTEAEADQLTRWLCSSCNLRRGAGRSDKHVKQLAAKAQRKSTREQPITSRWTLEPKARPKASER